jgi:hypothetical protein
VHAVSVFENAGYAVQWLKEPNEALGGAMIYDTGNAFGCLTHAGSRNTSRENLSQSKLFAT